jgi:hypothetical protein
MGARFSGSFFSAYTSKEYTLTIYDESGSFVLKPVQLIDCAITYLNGADETFDPILPAELRADLLIDNADLDTFVEDLAAASEGRFLVKLERDSIIEFLGYVLPDLSEIEDIPIEVGYKFTLKATDGLGRLKGVQYSLFDDTPYSGFSTFVDIILKCLNKNTELQSFYGTKADFLKTLVNWHAEQYTYSNTIDPLLNTRVPERAFYTRDKKGNYKFRTCYDVLKSICEAWNARMIYSLASFQFLQVSELANYTSRKFFTYTRTGTQGDVTESFSITHNQTSGTTDLMRLAGGKFTFLPPLKYVLIDYKHIATENLGAGYEWDSSIGTNPQLLGEIDDQLGTARIFVNVLITYGATNFVTPPGVQGLWYVFNFTVQVNGSYLDRLISFVGGVPQPQSIGWSGSAINGYQVALFMPTDQQDYFQTISFITPNIQSSGDFNFDVYLHSVYTSAGQLITVPVADYYYTVGNVTIEHLYEGTLDGQSDIRRFIANNDTSGNSAFIEKETIIGDGIGVNSPGHLEVKNDTAAWVLADKWRIGNSGSYIPFSALKAQEIIRGQLAPIRKYNGTLFQKTDTLYRPNQVVLHSGTGTMVFMGGTFRLGVDEVDGTWFYINLETTGWTNQAPIDYPEGEGADAGKPKSFGGEDPGTKPIERTFREEFTGITSSITVTVNGGLLPTNHNQIWVYQNGQLISSSYYTISGDTITLTYTSEGYDEFTVIFTTF